MITLDIKIAVFIVGSILGGYAVLIKILWGMLIAKIEDVENDLSNALADIKKDASTESAALKRTVDDDRKTHALTVGKIYEELKAIREAISQDRVVTIEKFVTHAECNRRRADCGKGGGV